MDVGALADHMRDALTDRASLVREQSAVKEALFQYQWNDVARAYFRRISERLGELASTERRSRLSAIS
jgi:hypothetical protein